MTLMPVRVRAPFAQAGVRAANETVQKQLPSPWVASAAAFVTVAAIGAVLFVNYYYQSAIIARGIKLSR
jgi:hypothetical protein